jgi:uncharacterized protein (DUF952 family)
VREHPSPIRFDERKTDDRNYCLKAQVLTKLRRTAPPGIGSFAGRAQVTTIYKICDRGLWNEAQAAGQFVGSAVDRHDGFIHFSTAAQLPGTAAKHFAGLKDLILVAVDAGALHADLKWEPSRGGELFPHLHAALPLSAVLWARPLADEVGGRRALPELAS